MNWTTDKRHCPNCEKVYDATIIAEREPGGMLSVDVSECPDCGTPGQLILGVDRRAPR